MPIYEYYCHECGTTEETYRHIADMDREYLCLNGHAAERVISVPALSIWNPDRPFPNVVKAGPGTFPTRAAYESHLKANNIAEVKTDGKIKRPHGNKVVRSF